MCMCEVCQSSTCMQSALNTFRRNNLSQLENEYQTYSALSYHEKDQYDSSRVFGGTGEEEEEEDEED